MGRRFNSRGDRAFTLIELLVVIAIIAILAVVVVLTLNPAQLLAQSRDANRVSDMATLSSALNLYTTDQSGASSFNLGSSSAVYVSLSDPAISGNATSTCASLGLPPLSVGYAYQCSSPQNFRNANGTGWIPINFSNISSGSPLGNLPVDPVNASSSGLYYSYTTNGSQFTAMAVMESQKYKASITGVLGNGVDVVGSNVGAGPITWWTFNEGSGTALYDSAGNNNGTWYGGMIGTSGYYSAGKGSTWAGAFDGSSTYVLGSIANPYASIATNSARSYGFWIDPYGTSTENYATPLNPTRQNLGVVQYFSTINRLDFRICSAVTSTFFVSYYPTANTWQHLMAVYDPSSNNGYLYVNGVLSTTTSMGANGCPSWANPGAYTYIGSIAGTSGFFSGLIDDVRVYNRALSSQEVRAIYSAEH